MWNFQLISYAGYETEKSSEVDATKEGKSCPAVRGDPANVEFTKVNIDLTLIEKLIFL